MRRPCGPLGRDGSTLLVCIVAIAVLGALIAGVFVASWREAAIGASSISRARALAAAEFGAYSSLAPSQWRVAWNSSAGIRRVSRRHRALGPGLSSDVDVWTLGRSSVFVDAAAGAGSSPNAARRRVGLLVALRLPVIPRLAAATAVRGIVIADSSLVSGRDSSLGDCPPPDSNIAGLAVADSTEIDVVACTVKPCVAGSPPVRLTPLAGSVDTYERFGQVDRSFLSMLGAAIPSGASLVPSPRLDAAGECDADAPGNFGDPLRVLGANSPCAAFMALAHAGDLQLANGAGQGMLIADGSLTLGAGARFDGIVIARGEVRLQDGAQLTGLVLADHIVVSGGSRLQYSSCAVNRAIVAGARPVPQPGGSWVEMF